MAKNKKSKPVLVLPSLVIGNGKVTNLDKILRSKETQEGYARLIKQMNADPEHAAEILRATTWKGKSLDDMLSELGKG